MTPELLAPAGNWDCVRAAAANGADAVYFGLPRFNARMRADNFTEADLPELVAYCHRHGLKAYAAFNTLVFAGELAEAADFLRLLNRSGVDGVIVQDIGLARLARRITPELPIHASTQMTVTSPEGAALVRRELGVTRAVLARELSLRELAKFPAPEVDGLDYEVFVHGALCVAYSGQCLTSESLGRRSANRGECAQACRLPYDLLVDGALRDLGDRRYLLSPQDLAAVEEIPALLERGVSSFKIEGRLKSPEYVAAVCQVYRKALDAAMERRAWTPVPADRYQLEMAFSRGFYTGWLHGVNHQRLVAARFGKKRGALVGRTGRPGRAGDDFVEVGTLETAVKPGDGVVFDTGGDPDKEQGGRIYAVRGGRLFFQRGHVDFTQIPPGSRIWKTDDPALNAALKKSFSGTLEPRHREPVDLRDEVHAVFEFYEALADEKKIGLACSGDGVVAGDRMMLRRALNNLFANAIRHTPQGGTVSVHIAAAIEDGQITLSVENNGETIDAEHLPRLFDRFYRADPARQRDSEGAGLGLAITRAIVHAHGGRIGVSSRDGVTRFALRLPALQSPAGNDH